MSILNISAVELYCYSETEVEQTVKIKERKWKPRDVAALLKVWIARLSSILGDVEDDSVSH